MKLLTQTARHVQPNCDRHDLLCRHFPVSFACEFYREAKPAQAESAGQRFVLNAYASR
jgi:hypothetical protein